MVSLTPIFGGTSIPRTTVPSALLPPTVVQSIFSVFVHANIIVDNAINSPLRGFIRCPLSNDDAVDSAQVYPAHHVTLPVRGARAPSERYCSTDRPSPDPALIMPVTSYPAGRLRGAAK